MQIEITRGGQTNAVTIELDLANLSSQEAERVDEVFPPGVERVPSHRMIRALIWAKLLYTPFRDAKFDEIDFDLSELAAFAETGEEQAWIDEAVVLPMETPDGNVTEGHG
jgi:hypothetical protein